jgi:hypothetical protein
VPDAPRLRCANYTTRARAQAAVPMWERLYREAGLDRVFEVAHRDA